MKERMSTLRQELLEAERALQDADETRQYFTKKFQWRSRTNSTG